MNHVVGRNSSGGVKIGGKFHQVFGLGPDAGLARGGAQQHFGVEILADFVDELDGIAERDGNVFGEDGARSCVGSGLQECERRAGCR